MLNMIDTQDKLKNFSEDQLVREMQMPSGSAPQFMVLGEIERRKRMRADAQKQQGLMQPTVAQEAVSAAGVPQQGIAQIARSLAPKTDMAQNTGVPNVQAAGLPAQPNQPQRMAGGGIMRLAPGGPLSGGTMTAIASLKVNYPDLYEQYKDNPSALAQAAQAVLEVAEDPEMTTLEELEAPQTGRQRGTDTLNYILSKLPPRLNYSEREKLANQKQDIREYVARAGSQNAIWSYGDDDPIFAEGVEDDATRARNFARVAEDATARENARWANTVTPEYTTLEGLSVPQEDAYKSFTAGQRRQAGQKLDDLLLGTETYSADPIDLRFITSSRNPFGTDIKSMPERVTKEQLRSDLSGMSPEEYALDQQRQSLSAIGSYGDDDPIFAEGVEDDATRARNFAAENARRAYLAGGDDYRLPESDVPAVVDMLNRGRKFQLSNPYTEPSVVYPIAGNSALGTLKYSLTPDEQGTQFDYLAGLPEARLDAFERKGERRGLPPADTETFQELSDSLGAEKRAAEDEKIAATIAAREAAREAEERLDVFERRGLPTTPTEDRLALEAREAARKADSRAAARVAEGVMTPNESTKRPKLRPEGLRALTEPATKVGSTSAAAAKIGEKLSPREKQANQDKWLALAQAGFTLMNTGDFGEAGSAGLAALRNSKQADLEERKVAASEALTAAKIAAAGRKGGKSGIKAPAAAALTFYQKQVENAEAALETAETTADRVAAQNALGRAQESLRQLLVRYELSQGLPGVGGSSSGIGVLSADVGDEI